MRGGGGARKQEASEIERVIVEAGLEEKSVQLVEGTCVYWDTGISHLHLGRKRGRMKQKQLGEKNTFGSKFDKSNLKGHQKNKDMRMSFKRQSYLKSMCFSLQKQIWYFYKLRQISSNSVWRKLLI